MRGQISKEYLMTYGVPIILVVIIFMGLFYSDAFDSVIQEKKDFENLCIERCNLSNKTMNYANNNRCECCKIDKIETSSGKHYWESKRYDCETFYLKKVNKK